MEILVLGGTGAMGVHLVHFLTNTNANVTVTSRRSHQSYANIKYIVCNAKNSDELSKVLLKKWDVIVDFMAYDTTQLFTNNITNILSQTNQYIFLSSARVYDNLSTVITEQSTRLLDTCVDSEYLNTDEYALSKARQENALINGDYANWTIIRPYITYDTYRMQLGTYELNNWLYRAINKRSVVFDTEMLNRKTTMTYGADVAKRITAIIGNKAALGEVYQIATNEFKTWRQVMDIYFDAIEEKLGFRPNCVEVKNIQSALNIKNSKHQIVYDRMFDRVFDSSKINTLCLDDNYTNLKEGLTKCLDDFLLEPYFGNINWGFEAIKDKIANERIRYSEIGNVKKYLNYFKCRYF